nr:integrase, catalytic region, zinc finger, CCHC-type, peptidase aspartic, catalytic [Tanacetum cinerariifolium]
METMNVSFNELLEMAFEQCSSKPELQSMTSGHISSGLDLTYAPSTITTQQPTEGELDLLFEAVDLQMGKDPARHPTFYGSVIASLTFFGSIVLTVNAYMNMASCLVRFSIKSSAGELESARGGGTCVEDEADDDGGQDNAFDNDVDEQPVLDLALNVENMFQTNDCDAFDFDVDEASTAQTMFMANLSYANLVTDEAGLSYDSDILSEIQDHDQYQDAACAHHKGHAPTAQTMFMANLSSADHVTDEARPSYDSNILSEVPDHEHYQDTACAHHEGHYVKDNEVPVVHSDASSVPTDAFLMIYNDMCEFHDQSVSNLS